MFDAERGRDVVTGYDTFEYELTGGARPASGDFLDSAGLEIVDYAPPLFLRVKAIRFDAFLAAHVRSRPITASWSRTRVRARRRVMYAFVNKGTLEIRGRATSVSPLSGGVGMVFPGSGDVILEGKSDTEVIYFTFDMNEIRPLHVEPDALASLRADSPVYRAAYSYLSGLVHAPERADGGSAFVLRELTRDVARALALESSSAPQNQDIIARVRQVIERRHRSAAFTPDDLARELGLSRRLLERACAEKGIRISDEVRTQRARHALHLLLERPDLPLHAVAAGSGFGSAEVMRRAFWRYYKSSPAAIRKTAAVVEDEVVLGPPEPAREA